MAPAEGEELGEEVEDVSQVTEAEEVRDERFLGNHPKRPLVLIKVLEC